MSNEKLVDEIERLNGELFAIRALVFYLLDHLRIRDPNLINMVFDAAADHAEAMTLKEGKKASPQHLAKALEIIEDFRSKIVPE